MLLRRPPWLPNSLLGLNQQTSEAINLETLRAVCVCRRGWTQLSEAILASSKSAVFYHKDEASERVRFLLEGEN